jgi:hypothetical protein
VLVCNAPLTCLGPQVRIGVARPLNETQIKAWVSAHLQHTIFHRHKIIAYAYFCPKLRSSAKSPFYRFSAA